MRRHHIVGTQVALGAVALLVASCTAEPESEVGRASELTTPSVSEGGTPADTVPPPGQAQQNATGDTLPGVPVLEVSTNGRYLVDARRDEPFVWLGDTAWRLARTLTREEVTRYLENRAQRGFTVIQMVALDRIDVDFENAAGEAIIASRDPLVVNDAHLEHLDFILDEAERLGLVVAMVPEWANRSLPAGVLDEPRARELGRTLGERFRERNGLVWVLGGDFEPTGFEDVIHAWAEGLDEGDGGRHLMTYHATGSSGLASRYFQEADWIDFYAIQSSHTEPCRTTWEHVTTDYELNPARPTIDIEPPYEEHAIGWDPANGRFTAAENRRSAYWQLLAGSAGHTYGHVNVWAFLEADHEEGAGFVPGVAWEASLDSPGAEDMGHVRALLETRPILESVPDQTLIVDGQEDDDCGQVRAARTEDGRHVFVYTPRGAPVTVDLSSLEGSAAAAWWFNPRIGEAVFAGEHDTESAVQLVPPAGEADGAVEDYGGESGTVRYGTDWVLVVDSTGVAEGLPAPGAWSPQAAEEGAVVDG